MQKKEYLVHQSDQTVLNSSKWLKKLTMILTSVLLLTMFGLGGYWVGVRQQQSLPLNVLTMPKPSWLPSATPAQRHSVSSAITPSQTDPTYNWKAYQEKGVPFTFQYPPAN